MAEIERDNVMYYDEKKQWLVVEGLIAEDLRTFPTKPRPRRGDFRAARFDDLAGNTMLGCHLGEMMGTENIGHRHVDEAAIYMVTGRGYSVIYQGEDPEDPHTRHRIDWQAGSLVAIPINAYHQHFNLVHPDSVRQLAIKNVPTLRKVGFSTAAIYDDPMRFTDRFNDEPDYWEISERAGERLWRCNVVPDLKIFPLDAWPERGEGVSAMFFDMAGMQTLRPHVTELAPSGRTRAHHHLREELILILSGRGHTLIWNDGGPEIRVEWSEGDLFSPPLNAWHQHFNADPKAPARYYSVENMAIEQLTGGNTDFIEHTAYAFHDRFS